MSFEVNAITALSEINDLVKTFASSELGWTVTGEDIFIPGSTNPVNITNSSGPTFNNLNFEIPSLSATIFASLDTPRLNGTIGAPVLPSPTNLYLYGGTEESQPFLAGIVAFGFNRYRHFYIGSMIKYGSYTGGEIIQAGYHGTGDDGDTNSLTFSKYPFGARTSQASTLSGFVNVVHADAGDPVKVLRRGSDVGAFDGEPQGDIALGGYSDRVNSNYTDRAQQHFANASVLGPINLYATKSGLDRYFPIGRPPGVRMVNMENIEPGVLVTISGTDWRVFPVFRRSFSTTFTAIAGGYNAEETSYRRGLAYPEVA